MRGMNSVLSFRCCRFLFVSGLLLFLLTSPVIASEPAALVGTWMTNTGDVTLVFYGNGMGSREADVDRTYFAYAWSETNNLTLNFGAGVSETYGATLAEDSLSLIGREGQTVVYEAQGDLLGSCVKSLHQLAGAKALYRLDNPDATRMSIRDLSDYLDSMPPPCPEGGMYIIGDLDDPPRCTVPSHSIE